MSLISDLMTGGVGSLVETVVKGADALFTSDKERMAADAEMERLGIQREEAYLKDTQSARQMQVAALQQDDLFSKRFIYGFAIFWSLFAMVFFVFVTFGEVPEKNLRMADTILGFLIGTAIAGIFNFFLGTTYRSQKKDETISTLARENQK